MVRELGAGGVFYPTVKSNFFIMKDKSLLDSPQHDRFIL